MTSPMEVLMIQRFNEVLSGRTYMLFHPDYYRFVVIGGSATVAFYGGYYFIEYFPLNDYDPDRDYALRSEVWTSVSKYLEYAAVNARSYVYGDYIYILGGGYLESMNVVQWYNIRNGRF